MSVVVSVAGMNSSASIQVQWPHLSIDKQCTQGVLKKRNLFYLEYLQVDLFKLIVLLGGYSVLPYNSIKPNFGFLQRLQTELCCLELEPLKSLNFRNYPKAIILQIILQDCPSNKSLKIRLQIQQRYKQPFDIKSIII